MRINVTPDGCMPPHKVSYPEKVTKLLESFTREGWAKDEPALVGYRWENGKVQLITGSHRWAAAAEINLAIPVELVSDKEVLDAWGDLDKWKKLLERGNHGNRIESSQAQSL